MTRPPPKKVAHRSLDFRRRRFCAREESFAAQWEHENVRRRGISFGHGILQDLMFEPNRPLDVFSYPKCRQIIRNREAAIVATIVQWLGTNVGNAFLEEALARHARQIVEIEPGPRTSWVRAAERLPKKSGRYVVRPRFNSYVSTTNSQADFLVGVKPGTTGIWTTVFSRETAVEWWYEPRELNVL